jgi:hypothetical protein
MLFQPLDLNLTVQTMQDTIHAPHERWLAYMQH